MRIKRPPKGWFKIHRDVIIIDRSACLFHTLLFQEYLKEKGISHCENIEQKAVYGFIEWLEEKWGVCGDRKHDLRIFPQDNEIKENSKR